MAFNEFQKGICCIVEDAQRKYNYFRSCMYLMSFQSYFSYFLTWLHLYQRKQKHMLFLMPLGRSASYFSCKCIKLLNLDAHFSYTSGHGFFCLPFSAGILKQSMGARNRFGIRLSYQPARAKIF
jgi:hypothetical protein